MSDIYLKNEIEEANKWAVDIYRKIHMYPETGNEEYRTAALVEAQLAEIGLVCQRPLLTSVTAEQHAAENIKAEKMVSAGKNKNRLVMRCELDAIDIKEETGLHHASCREGFMHACGHDVHIAVILGTARVSSKIKDNLV